jgi:hypothetical protein
MAEITANFGGKDITIIYPDALLGKAEEAFVGVYAGKWETAISDKKASLITNDDQTEEDIELTDEQISELRYEFTIGCIMDFIKETITKNEINTALKNVESSTRAEVETSLSQISLGIEELSSGPDFV